MYRAPRGTRSTHGNRSQLGPHGVPRGRYDANRYVRVGSDLDPTSNRFVHSQQKPVFFDFSFFFVPGGGAPLGPLVYPWWTLPRKSPASWWWWWWWKRKQTTGASSVYRRCEDSMHTDVMIARSTAKGSNIHLHRASALMTAGGRQAQCRPKRTLGTI